MGLFAKRRLWIRFALRHIEFGLGCCSQTDSRREQVNVYVKKMLIGSTQVEVTRGSISHPVLFIKRLHDGVACAGLSNIAV